MNSNSQVTCVYSDMHIAKEKEVATKVGKVFRCGTVSAGGQTKKYSKMIETSNLSAFQSMYPDVSIVMAGKKSDLKVIEPAYVTK